MSFGSSTKHASCDDDDLTEVPSPKRSKLQSRGTSPKLASYNPTKHHDTTSDDSEGGTLPKCMKQLPKSVDLALNTRPSRSIPPPDRPGSLQTALASRCAEPGQKSETICTSSIDNEYTYSRLRPGEIRLLRVHPPRRRGKSQIECSLVTDDSEAPSAYEALSYVWGDATLTHRILVSDEDDSGTFKAASPFHVGANLFNALRALRLHNRPLILWVDALCIDQSNIEERNAQVAMMSKIYTNAHRVLVWLGPSDPHSDRVFSNLHQVFSSGFFSVPGQHNKADDCRGLTPSDLLASLSNLLSRPYWGRVWIIQEVAFASKATVVCGHHQIDIEDLRTAVELFRQWYITNRSDPEHILPGLERAHTLLSSGTNLLRRSASGELIGRKETLAELVLHFRDFHATDPRDQIYGFISLASDGVNFAPDYGKSWRETSRLMCGHAIRRHDFLDVIAIPCMDTSMSSWRSPSAKDAYIPSWIAPLGNLPYGNPHKAGPRQTRQNGETLASYPPIYNSANNTKPHAHFGPLIVKRSERHNGHNGQPLAISQPIVNADSSQDMVLHVEGLKIGTVTDLSTRMADGLISRDALEMLGLLFTEGCQALRIIPDATVQCLWRTLVANRDDSGKPAPTRFGLAFNNLFRRILQLRSLDTVELLEGEDDPNTRAFLKRARDVTWNRRVFLSKVNEFDEKMLGLAPKATCIGDAIVMLFGLSVPIILRPSRFGGRYVEIVGAAYVDGKMEGEILHQLGESRVEELTEEIEIV